MALPRSRSQQGKPGAQSVDGIPADRSRLTCAEVATLFVVSSQHVRRLCETGELRAEPVVGRKRQSVNYWSIPVAAVAEFIRRRTQPGAGMAPETDEARRVGTAA